MIYVKDCEVLLYIKRIRNHMNRVSWHVKLRLITFEARRWIAIAYLSSQVNFDIKNLAFW